MNLLYMMVLGTEIPDEVERIPQSYPAYAPFIAFEDTSAIRRTPSGKIEDANLEIRCYLRCESGNCDCERFSAPLITRGKLVPS